MNKEQPEALRLADVLMKRQILNIGDGSPLDEAAAELRRLHTENTALRVTEDNLRQELQECQDQRRAAFRRIEELDAMRAQIGQGEPVGQCMEHGECFGGECIYATKPNPAPQQPLPTTSERRNEQADGF